MSAASAEHDDLRQAFDAMVDGVVQVDRDGHILLANRAACRMLGWDPTAREIVGLDLSGRAYLDDGTPFAPLDDPVSRALAGETVRDLPIRFLMSSGHAASMLVSASPLVREDSACGAILSFHDITMQEAAMSELRESARFSAALAKIGEFVGSTLEVDEIMRAAIRETCDAIGAESATIVMRSDGQWLTTYSHRFPKDTIGFKYPDEEVPHAAQALYSATPVAVDDALNDPRVNRSVMELHGIRSVLTMPLIQHGEVAGVMFLNHHTAPVAFTHRQVNFVAAAATSISLALRNAELFEAERRVADTLQQAMLKLPERIPGVEFACLYHSATESARVGGDFYDLFSIGSGRIGVAIGDVSGKGIDAAATAAMAKNLVRAYALLGEPPAGVLRMANEALRPSLDPSTFVTLLFGILDTEGGTFTYSSGGHPPGILLSGSRAPRMLREGGTVLGPFSGSEYSEETCPIEAGDTLVLYTDGVTEAGKAGHLYGEERLVETLAAAPAGASVNRLLEHLFFDVFDYAESHLSDDLAVVALRFAPVALSDQPPGS